MPYDDSPVDNRCDNWVGNRQPATLKRQFLIRLKAGAQKPRRLIIATSILGVATVLFYEIRTSWLEAKLLSSIAANLSYGIARGASSSIVFPVYGPANERRGYTALPEFQERLGNSGFHVVAQSVFSPELERFVSWGFSPPYRQPAGSGLIIRATDREILYNAAWRHRLFTTFDEIPPLAVKSLLFIENRELDDSYFATRNPVVDWRRSSKAAFSYAGRQIGLQFPVEGGSTLATQLEKFRYAKGGRTGSVTDKLRQMLSASMRVYRDGPDTRSKRNEIILDYVNSVPLSAAPRYGEVNGLGDGLYAWFGIDIDNLRAEPGAPRTISPKIYKHVLALICAAPAPSFYLLKNRAALEDRIHFYVQQQAAAGMISPEFTSEVQRTNLEFIPRAPALPPPVRKANRKATAAVRNHLRNILDVPNLYALDRLHLEVTSTLNARLQSDAIQLFERLREPAFVEANGLRASRLLLRGDPAHVNYSFTLFERTPFGNMLRVQADTLKRPFDLNEGMKLELGSTAKLWTLAHYLDLAATLYGEFQQLDVNTRAQRASLASDPISRWVAETMTSSPGIDLSSLLEDAVDRKYSASSHEVFFTGGGAHRFVNFDRKEDTVTYTLLEGLKHSVNLVYIRLMRDLVKFHEARLAYDTGAVLNHLDHPERARLLKEIADEESRLTLARVYGKYRDLPEAAAIDQILKTQTPSTRRLTMLFLAWNPDANAGALQLWLEAQGHSVSQDEANRLFKSYDPARLNLSDYGYLLGRHPLEVWCAGELLRNPDIAWHDLLERSGAARDISSQWLFKTKNRRAQERRLRIRFEQDAFARMTPYWQRLGFPFDRLVPSLATAIGSSADRPSALAELMGIILNDGMRLPVLRFEGLDFARETPYETRLQPDASPGKRVVAAPVARVLRRVLAGVVEDGTARRLDGVFVDSHDNQLITGGKTGSGDNRFETFGPGGILKSSRVVSRTGTFVFYIGDRYFGVVTAYVGGDEAQHYFFTSALAVAALILLAPSIEAVMNAPASNFIAGSLSHSG